MPPDARRADGAIDARVAIADRPVDAVRADSRGLITHHDAHHPRDAAPVPDGGVDAPIAVADARAADVPAMSADAPPLCDVELVQNGDFDGSVGSGPHPDPSPWVEDPTDIVSSAAELAVNGLPAPQSGDVAAWLGGENARIDELYQIIAVPADARSLVVRGYYNIRTHEPAPGTFDTMTLRIYDRTGAFLEELHAWFDEDFTTDWTPFEYAAVGDYSGQTVIVAFESANGLVHSTSFLVDTISATAHVCP